MEMRINNSRLVENVYGNDKLFDFIVSREGIFQALMSSKVNGSAIGIYSPPLGNTMFITGVDDVLLTDDDTIIVLKKYDMSGNILEKYAIGLENIVSVCPFTSPLKNPFLENIEKDTDWYTIINSGQYPSSLAEE